MQESVIIKVAVLTPALGVLIPAGILFLLAVGMNFYYTAVRMRKKFRQLSDEIEKKDLLIRNLEAGRKNFLEEKKILLKEAQDRVINNLQMLASLLNRQSSYLKKGDALDAIRIIQQRLHAISLVHHILSQSENFSTLNIRNYTYALVEYLADRMDSDTKIHFNIQMEGIILHLEQAVPVGLIIHEALTNAMAYGFPPGIRGIITVRMIRDQNRFLLSVSDNGVGLPYDYDLNTSDTLGFRLMEGLARQIGGQLTMESLPGLRIEVWFEEAGSSSS